MTGPAAAVAAVRRAVRAALVDAPGELVLVAASGGPDSTALAAAAAFEGRRAGWRCGAVVVDHQLQAESASVAGRAAAQLSRLGIEPVEVATVTVGTVGGPEAAARAARYAAIDDAANRMRAAVVLLGHTLDDQAESLLLGLARGSGARSLRAMAPVSGRYRRPLLEIDRATTRAACAAEALEVWDDPHNHDAAFTRVRVRRELAGMEEAIGPGVAEALARSARLLADDDDALERWASEVREQVRTVDEAGRPAVDAVELERVPAAVRRRVLRAEVLEHGVPGGDLRASHLIDLDALVARWRGQGPVHLPAGVRAWRDCGRLVLDRSAAEAAEGSRPAGQGPAPGPVSET